MVKLLFPFLITFAFASKLSEDLQNIKRKYNLPGLAAAFYQDGILKEIASVGVRKVGFSSLIQTIDKFHLGSCSKAMAATLAGIFVEKGFVNWDSKLKELLPEINLNAGYENVTFEMLFAHRSGLTKSIGWGDLWNDLKDPNIKPEEGRELVAKTLLVKSPEVEPGSKWHYSNAGYMVAGHILEKIAGKPFEILLKERLFEPIGMTSCGFGPVSDPNSAEPEQPWGHYTKDGQTLPIHADNPPAYAPAGTVHCSLQDWSKFLQAHLDGFNGKGGIVRVETFKKLHTPYPAKEVNTLMEVGELPNGSGRAASPLLMEAAIP